MLHELSPFIFRFSEDFGLRWYGFSYLLGFVWAYFLIRWLAARQNCGLQDDSVGDFISWCAVGVVLGGRLGYCIFYSPDLFISFRSEAPFWGVLALNEGGMASHGGMIGLVIACAMFAYRFQINRLYLFDLVAIGGPIGIFFGRLANFINGELVGRVVHSDYRFAVKFPQDILFWPSNSPDKLSGLSSVVDKIPGMSQTQWLEWCQKFNEDPQAKAGIASGLQAILKSMYSGTNEIQQAVKQAIYPLLEFRHPSQLYEALLEGLLLFIILFIFWSKPRRPGVVGALFLTLYAFFRIVSEQFRLPDAHLGFDLLGLTRGQWLSLIMFIIGIVLLLIWGRRDSLLIPGWHRAQNVRIGRRYARG